MAAKWTSVTAFGEMHRCYIIGIDDRGEMWLSILECGIPHKITWGEWTKLKSPPDA